MAIYVDHARIPYRRMLMSHLLADSSQELEDARRNLGLPDGCTQYPGTAKEHLDISESKRREALDMGALEISSRELVGIIRKRRASAKHGK